MGFRMSSIQFMNNYQQTLNKAYQKQAKYLEQGDGSSIHRGSDDPINYSKFMRYNVADNENERYQKNVDTAISWMETSDNSVVHMADRIKTMSEKTVAAANSYNSTADFAAISKEMMAQIEQIVATANTQQADRYVFAGQMDTTEPFQISHDSYNRGMAKTLDPHQAAFFKGANSDDNATLYQMLTLEYDDGTYYLDTQSGYIYSKDFVDEGYKELIARGYDKITETDKGSASSATLARTYAVGTVSPMSVEKAWEVVNNAVTDAEGGENNFLQIIRSADINTIDDSYRELCAALKVLYDKDYSKVTADVADAKKDIVNTMADPTNIWYNYTITVTKTEYVDDGNSNPTPVTTYLEDDETTFSTDRTSIAYGPCTSANGTAYLNTLRNTYQNSGTAGQIGYTTYNFTYTTTEATKISWNDYDSTTGDLSTSTNSVTGTNWKLSNNYKTQIVNNLTNAIDEYATSNTYLTAVSSYATDGDTWTADEIITKGLDSVHCVDPESPSNGNLASSEIVTADQVQALAQSEIIKLAVDKCANYEMEAFKVSDAFTNQGLQRDDIDLKEENNAFVFYTGTQDKSTKSTASGLFVTMFSIDDERNVTETPLPETFLFSTIKQKIITYSGDQNYISMTKLNGANDRTSDVVNLTGQDLFGVDIFDNEESGNKSSGTASLNNLLTVYTQTASCDEHWLSSDGVTLADVAHATITISETTLGARLNLYNSVAEMLDNQEVVITKDITDVSGTDIAQLATKLMEHTTLYNMALALGGRVLPQSLADYL